jgi:hypothetical protein
MYSNVNISHRKNEQFNNIWRFGGETVINHPVHICHRVADSSAVGAMTESEDRDLYRALERAERKQKKKGQGLGSALSNIFKKEKKDRA